MFNTKLINYSIKNILCPTKKVTGLNHNFLAQLVALANMLPCGTCFCRDRIFFLWAGI